MIKTIIDDKTRYIKTGTAIQTQSKNGYPYVKILFAAGSGWAVFKSRAFDENLAHYKETGEHEMMGMYSIKKDGRGMGIFILCVSKKDEPFLRSVAAGKRKRKAYYIFDLDDDCNIVHKAPVYFDIQSEVGGW